MIDQIGFMAGFLKRAEDYRRRVEVIIKNKNNNILLGMKDGKIYVFPGGDIEAGESVEEAAKREVQEETGKNVGQIHKTKTPPAVYEGKPNGPGKEHYRSKTYYAHTNIKGGRPPKNFGAYQDILPRLRFFPPSRAAKLVRINQSQGFEDIGRHRARAILSAIRNGNNNG